jgi:hypothetical protein
MAGFNPLFPYNNESHQLIPSFLYDQGKVIAGSNINLGDLYFQHRQRNNRAFE